MSDLNTIESPIPSHYLKTMQKAKGDLSQSDLIVELIDARIIRSTYNLFDYKNSDNLSSIKRAVIILNWDSVPNEDLKNWEDFFKKENIFVLKFDILNLPLKETIIKHIYNNGLISRHENSDPINISLVHSFFDLEEKIEEILEDWSGGTRVKNTLFRKNICYRIDESININLITPVIGVNCNNKETYWNLLILNKIDIVDVSATELAMMAIKRVANTDFNLLNQKYNLNLKKNSSLSNGKLYEHLRTIAIQNNFISDYEETLTDSVSLKIIEDIRNNSFGKLCLEKV